MSDEYAEGNGEAVMELFYKRSIYLVDANNDKFYSDEQNLVDFGFAEKILYGRVNRQYIPIILNTPLMPLKNLAPTPGTRAGFSLPAYVADAFRDLVAQFDKSRMGGKIFSNQKYLSTLSPFKAYEDPRSLYYQHSIALESVMTEYYIENNLYFKTFDEFLRHFKRSLIKTAPQFPITLPAYVKSKHCPMRASGLVVEIADLSFSNDQEKMDYFVNDPNWSFYLNACRSYGFSVDRRAPWRLVADIASAPMLEYAARYGFGNTEMLIGTSYIPAHAPFYRGFKDFLLRFYNLLKPSLFTESEYCQNGVVIHRPTSPLQYTTDRLSKLYPEEFFLKLYFEIRFLEEEQKFSIHEQKRMIKECLEIYKTKLARVGTAQADAANDAVGAFELILNRTYTYKGSLTDFMKHVKIVEDAELE